MKPAPKPLLACIAFDLLLAVWVLLRAAGRRLLAPPAYLILLLLACLLLTDAEKGEPRRQHGYEND